MILPKPFAIGCCSLLALAFVSIAAAEQPRKAGGSGDVVTSSHNLHPVTLVRTLDVLRDGRRQKKKSEPNFDNPFHHLRRAQEDDGQSTTCEAALAEAEENLATCEEKEEGPSYMFVQMADQCIFQTTDGGNTVLKSRHFHDVTVVFSDRPFEYEEEIATESFFDDFDATFNAGNGGKPNAAITLVQNDESKDVVVSVFVKAVVKHRDDPDGPTYVYKLEQSDEQASVASLQKDARFKRQEVQLSCFDHYLHKLTQSKDLLVVSLPTCFLELESDEQEHHADNGSKHRVRGCTRIASTSTV